MAFKDKYTTDKTQNPDKIEISKDFYAIGEVLDDILNKLASLNTKF